MPWIDDFGGTGCLADAALGSARSTAEGVVFALIYRQPSNPDETLPGSTRLRFALSGRGFVDHLASLFPKAEKRVMSFLTEPDLRIGWAKFAAELRQQGKSALAGAIMSHATPDGIEAKPSGTGAANDGTLTASEITGLARLPWHAKGFMVLCGCRSALGDHPANAHFAGQQGVPVLGQVGWAKFSSEWTRLKPHDGEAVQPPVYLWAFADGRNSLLGGDGGSGRMPGIVARTHP